MHAMGTTNPQPTSQRGQAPFGGLGDAGAGSDANAGTDVVTIALLSVGAITLLTGVWAFLSPGTFYDAIAAFPPRNDHFLRDVGSFQVALGLLGLVAARRATWRTPALGMFTVMYALHAISHLININDAESDALGIVEFVLLAGTALALGGLYAREARK